MSTPGGDYRQLPADDLVQMLEELETLLDYFRAPVSVRIPGTLQDEPYVKLAERLAAHLNPEFLPVAPTPAELAHQVRELHAKLALTKHSPAANGGWCGTCFESWPCAFDLAAS